MHGFFSRHMDPLFFFTVVFFVFIDILVLFVVSKACGWCYHFCFVPVVVCLVLSVSMTCVFFIFCVLLRWGYCWIFCCVVLRAFCDMWILLCCDVFCLVLSVLMTYCAFLLCSWCFSCFGWNVDIFKYFVVLCAVSFNYVDTVMCFVFCLVFSFVLSVLFLICARFPF